MENSIERTPRRTKEFYLLESSRGHDEVRCNKSHSLNVVFCSSFDRFPYVSNHLECRSEQINSQHVFSSTSKSSRRSERERDEILQPYRIVEDKKKRRKNSISAVLRSVCVRASLLLLFYHRSLLSRAKNAKLSLVDLEFVCFAFCGDVAKFIEMQLNFGASILGDE